MSTAAIFQKGITPGLQWASKHKLQAATSLGSDALAIGAGMMSFQAYGQGMKRVEKLKELSRQDIALRKLEATRRHGAVRAAAATPGYANVGVRGDYGSAYDALLEVDAVEGLAIKRLQQAQSFLIEDAKYETQAQLVQDLFAASNTLVGNALQSYRDVRPRSTSERYRQRQKKKFETKYGPDAYDAYERKYDPMKESPYPEWYGK